MGCLFHRELASRLQEGLTSGTTFQGPAELLQEAQLPLALSAEERLFSRFPREPGGLLPHSLISETAHLSAWEEPQGSQGYRLAGISGEGRAPGTALPWPGQHMPFQTEEGPTSDGAGVERQAVLSELWAPGNGPCPACDSKEDEGCLRQPKGGPCLGSHTPHRGLCISWTPRAEFVST